MCKLEQASDLELTFLSMAASISGYPALSSVMPGKRSSMRDIKSGSSSSTSLERFMSRNTRITIIGSPSSGLALLNAPKVRNTDRMFRRPKS